MKSSCPSEPRIPGVTGVVLAGGRSARMGRHKARLMLDGRTLLDRCVAVLDDCFPQTLVVKEDDVPGLGPLGGLQTALRRAATPAVFVVACDMPFLSAALIRDMCVGFEAFDAVVIQVAGRTEPLHALYQRRILPVIEHQIGAGDYSLQRLLARLHLKTVSDSELGRHPGWQRALQNVNTPADWERVRSQGM